MNAQEALQYMKDTGKGVRYAGNTLWCDLGDEFIYGGCYIEDCEGCHDKDTIEEWLDYHTKEKTKFEKE